MGSSFSVELELSGDTDEMLVIGSRMNLEEGNTVFAEVTPLLTNTCQTRLTDMVLLSIITATTRYMKVKDTTGTTFNMDLTRHRRMKPPHFIRRQVK